MILNEEQIKNVLVEVFDNVFNDSHYKEDIIMVMSSYLKVFNINNVERLSSFLAQTGHESKGFTSLVENLNYSTEGLLKTFSRNRITFEECEMYGRNVNHPAFQQEIANIVYGREFGMKHLGNVLPNDGWNFRGRGWLQHTGRHNYTKLSNLINQSVCSDPSILEYPDWATYAAMIVWDKEGFNDIADSLDEKSVSIKLNGGTNGLKERISLKNRIKTIIVECLNKYKEG